MVKLVAIAGSIGEQSYNRMLLEFIRDHFKKTVDIEILDINDVPMFNEDEDHNDNPVVHELARKISGAFWVCWRSWSTRSPDCCLAN